LGSILNNANAAKRFLKSKKPDLDEIRDIIADIISEDRRASDIMQKLRALMKKTEAEFSPLKINDIMDEVLNLMHSEIVIKKISLSKQLAKKLPKVNGERIQLQQAFLNLIINAIDAMKGCKVKNLHISIAKHDAKSIIICVRDSGTGFDEKNKDSLFKPFFTTKREGLGMGLSVNKTIVNSHGGDIWVENNKEGGASFLITLPVYKEQSS
jgi:two-component system sensor kinase FixL